VRDKLKRIPERQLKEWVRKILQLEGDGEGTTSWSKLVLDLTDSRALFFRIMTCDTCRNRGVAVCSTHWREMSRLGDGAKRRWQGKPQQQQDDESEDQE
jgi:hypothetical protein